MERFKWPAPSNDFFRRHLSSGEQATIDFRIERYKFLWEEFGPPADMLLFGGFPAMFALEEMKRSFAYGNFMATVLLAQVFVEQTRAGHFSIGGEDKIADGSFKGLIDEAQKRDWISSHVAESLHQLRKMRNPYTHRVGGTGPRTYMGRIISEKFVPPEDLVVEDARFAIRVVVDYLRYGSPECNPDKVKWNESDHEV